MNDTILIEPFTINDLESISDILENDFDDFWNYNVLKNELKNESNVFLCCKIENEIIGFIGASIILDIAELNNIVIKKTYRGKGISSLLLDNLLKNLKRKGCKKINLEVAVSNVIAIKLYKKFGFSQVGQRKGYCFLLLTFNKSLCIILKY